MSSDRHKKKPVTGQKKTYSTTDIFFGVCNVYEKFFGVDLILGLGHCNCQLFFDSNEILS
jgi:hypothetical protein